jgi:peroxiredoxin
VELNENLDKIEKENAVLLAAVTDPLKYSEEVANEFGINVPIMYDVDHKIGSKYGVYNVPGGMDMGPVDTHSIFVIDGEGIVQWSEISIQEMYVPLDPVMEALKKL